MSGIVDPEKRQKAILQVSHYLGLRPGDAARFDVTFVGTTDHFLVRIDYTASRQGGFQIIEGNLFTASILSTSQVMGRGRANPRRPMVPTCEVVPTEKLEEIVRRRDIALDFEPMLDEERTI